MFAWATTTITAARKNACPLLYQCVMVFSPKEEEGRREYSAPTYPMGTLRGGGGSEVVVAGGGRVRVMS